MVSSKFPVSGDAGREAASRYVNEEFARAAGLSSKDAIRLDLLTEETLGMVKAMVDDFYGQLWFVSTDEGCELHVEATANMDSGKKHELLSVSSTGRNAAARGFMPMIGELISSALYHFGSALDFYGEQTVKYGIVHVEPSMMQPVNEMTTIWTLRTYRNSLSAAKEEEAAIALDDLEKSIVASLADDVIVGVKGDRIELIIKKKF